MVVPWETIIKMFRSDLGATSFHSLGDYADSFLSFLREERELSSAEVEDRSVALSIVEYFSQIVDEIFKYVRWVLDEHGDIEETAIADATARIIQMHFDMWEGAEELPSVPDGFISEFKAKYGEVIRNVTKSTFENLPLSGDASKQLFEIAVGLFVKFPIGIRVPGTSGIVIAGFGAKDIFPVVESFLVGGRIGEYLKFGRDEPSCDVITISNPASILAFAQGDMVFTFMEGVDPRYQSQIDRYVEKICSSYPEVLVDGLEGIEVSQKSNLKERLREIGQEVFMDYMEKLANYRTRQYIQPVMSVVEGLPKDELATMAESLISLTSFKRKVSMQDETVGGPIDVAVLSKGDGFIWIKRKHYFDSGLNPQFFANYYN